MLEVEVEREEEERSLEQAYYRLVKKAEVPGFRKGKAPRAMLERYLGREALLRDALEHLIPELLSKAIEEQGLDPIAQPDIEVTHIEPMAFKAVVPLIPTVELGNYRELRVDAEPAEVSDEQVDKVIEQIRQQYAPWGPVERPVQIGDLVTMDVEGRVGEESLDKREGIQYEVLSGFAFPVPGFAEELVGLEKGQQKEFTKSFPADHERSDLAGRECWFKVLVTEVKEKKLPNLDDDFARSVGEQFSTLQALREQITFSLQRAGEQQSRARHEEKTLDAVVAASKVEFPPVVVEAEIDRLISEQERELRANRMSLEDYLSRMKMGQEQLREEFRPIAAKRVARSLVLGKVSDEENIQVSDEEIEAEVERMAQAAGEKGGELKELFRSSAGRQSLERVLLTGKTVKRLTDMASGVTESQESMEGSGADSVESTGKGGEEDA